MTNTGLNGMEKVLTVSQALVAAYFLKYEGRVGDVTKVTGLRAGTGSSIMRRFVERNYLTREEIWEGSGRYNYYAQEWQDEHLEYFVSGFRVIQTTDPWTVIRTKKS
jgi:hypothetical protein